MHWPGAVFAYRRANGDADRTVGRLREPAWKTANRRSKCRRGRRVESFQVGGGPIGAPPPVSPTDPAPPPCGSNAEFVCTPPHFGAPPGRPEALPVSATMRDMARRLVHRGRPAGMAALLWQDPKAGLILEPPGTRRSPRKEPRRLSGPNDCLAAVASGHEMAVLCSVQRVVRPAEGSIHESVPVVAFATNLDTNDACRHSSSGVSPCHCLKSSLRPMSPPNSLCPDEKSQIQAPDCPHPLPPLRPGLPERRTRDDKRHDTTSLFAALNAATGEAMGKGRRQRKRDGVRRQWSTIMWMRSPVGFSPGPCDGRSAPEASPRNDSTELFPLP